MYPDAPLKAAPLRINRAWSVAEEGTRKSLEYSTIDIANARRLIIEFQTALISTYETLEVLRSTFAIMAGKAKIRVAVCCPVRLDRIDGPAQTFDGARGGIALFLCFVRIELLIVDRPFELIDRLFIFAQAKIGISEIFMERIAIRRRGEYAGQELRRAGEITTVAQHVGERGFIFRVSGFGSYSRLELTSRFIGVT